MRTKPFPMIVLLVSGLLMSGCAPMLAYQGAPAPRLTMPKLATDPCAVTVLHAFTNADLETGYDARGAEVKTCDDHRQLAVDTFADQQRALDEWEAARAKRDKPAWQFWK